MDRRIQGWVMENPPVKAALDRLHAEHPRMQVAFLEHGIRHAREAGDADAEGVDPRVLVVKAEPTDAEARWAVEPDGTLIDLRGGE